MFLRNRDTGECTTDATRSAISEDHSVIHTWNKHVRSDEIIDMHGIGLFHASGSFIPTDATTALFARAVRVYDDLVLVFSHEGITAFTPRGS